MAGGRHGSLTVSARGKDAIDAVRRPLSVALIAYGGALAAIVFLVLVRSELPNLKEMMTRWLP